MAKEIKYSTEARELLKNGVDKTANAVKQTLGAKGRNVIIDNGTGTPQITKDGVTVAREISLEDATENLGSQLIKNVAIRTNEEAGDGTTTATVLAQSIYTVGLKNITAGASPISLQRGIEKAVKVVVAELKEQSESISDDFKRLEQIATVSANNDEEIGKNIVGALKLVSKDGVITIEDAKGTETIVEHVEGLQFEKGYMSPYFVTDQEKAEVVLDNPLIVLYDKRITTTEEVLAQLQGAAENHRSLLFICDDIESNILSLLVVNKIKGAINVCAVKSPSYGENRKDIMEDIAVLTGGVVISKDKGLKIEQFNEELLGECEKIIITKDTTTIINGKGVKEEIDEQKKSLTYKIENSAALYDKEKYQNRLARLSGGVAVIYVGANTEVEAKEKKDRFEDSLNATRAAIQEGVITGGGVALARCISVLDGMKGKNEDETTGIKIIQKAIEEPLRQIARNAGLDDSVILLKTLEGEKGFGYNVYTDKYENLLQSGIIDPTKVTRVALEKASSISSVMLTTECTIVEKKTQKQVNEE